MKYLSGKKKRDFFSGIDWLLFFSTIPLLFAGLITMRSLGAENLSGGGNYFFSRQIIWVAVSIVIFFIFSAIDWRFLRKSGMLILLFFLVFFVLVTLLISGKVIKGATSWLNLYFFSVEPSDLAKLVLVLILSKYFARRHVEIANVVHILISAVYAAVFAGLVFFQPDFGSALVLFLIWFGMIMVSGISKKHLLLVFLIMAIIFSLSWFLVLKPYQKDRIITFLQPLKDIRGSGYNSLQSMIAVGSGQIFGRGVGYGSQSRLGFLPEHQTDFVFAAFAEEWGLIGVIFVFLFYGVVIWRIISNAFLGESNFEVLFGVGLAILIASHFFINVGMNVGVMPITGIPLPFMSYGGSNLLTVFSGLGILMGMRRYNRRAHAEDVATEFLGPK